MKNTKSLKGKYLFRKTLRTGKYANSKYITLYVSKLSKYEEKKYSKELNFLGICVSKKHGNSVARNRIKRLIRESIKEIEESICIGYKIVVLVKKEVKVNELEFYIVKKQLEGLFKKLGVYKDE